MHSLFLRVVSVMRWLSVVVHLFVGSTYAGTGVIAVLSAGYATLVPIFSAALAGYVIAIPVSIIVVRSIAS